MNENQTQIPLSPIHRAWLEHPMTIALLGAIDAHRKLLDMLDANLTRELDDALARIAKLARGEV